VIPDQRFGLFPITTQDWQRECFNKSRKRLITGKASNQAFPKHSGTAPWPGRKQAIMAKSAEIESIWLKSEKIGG
jgi:hypothetical protein